MTEFTNKRVTIVTKQQSCVHMCIVVDTNTMDFGNNTNTIVVILTTLLKFGCAATEAQ